MENNKIKKPPKKIKFVRLKRTQKEWETIINDAKSKEMARKYMKEYYSEELVDREVESLWKLIKIITILIY